ncbi:putative plastid-lipid-associated protein 14, chloroplastic [Asimina triloba]
MVGMIKHRHLGRMVRRSGRRQMASRDMAGERERHLRLGTVTCVKLMEKNAPSVLPHANLMFSSRPPIYIPTQSPVSPIFSLPPLPPPRSDELPSSWYSLSPFLSPMISSTPISLSVRTLNCFGVLEDRFEFVPSPCVSDNTEENSSVNGITILVTERDNSWSILLIFSMSDLNDFLWHWTESSVGRRLLTTGRHTIGRPINSSRRSFGKLRCSAEKAVYLPQSKEDVSSIGFSCFEESNHVTKFKMSDFELSNHVSIGLSGRGDEVIFEATVKDPHSPLYNTRVVLRELTSSQAQRRGRRALEVLKRLARRQLMYLSYAMQVHGYVSVPSSGDGSSFTLVHGYDGSYSLRHWLQLSDWLPTLEATLALDEECVRKVGDSTTGGPTISRQLRLIRLLMRDLLIGVNYLHSHGLAHTELRLENVHISPVDRHIKVGILGNASDFYDSSLNNSTFEGNMDRRQLMIAFDMRCVGFMMAKMVLRELMDHSIFARFKSFLMKGNDPSCLREFLLPTLCTNSPSGNAGLQILDRNWGAGWNLLSLLLATKPSERISCLDALRHPFLCGPKWRVDPSMDIIKWGLGSTAVRIAEEYIYGRHQRGRLAYFIELMEMLNANSRAEDWLGLLQGRWRLLYGTGRHIGLTLRQASPRVLIGNASLTFTQSLDSDNTLHVASDLGFAVMPSSVWPHNKIGIGGTLHVSASVILTPGSRQYYDEERDGATHAPGHLPNAQESINRRLSGRRWRRASPIKEVPSSLPVVKLASCEIEVAMSIDSPSMQDVVGSASNILREVRMQVPTEMFDVSKFVCGTYVDARMLILRGVNGSALLFTRSCLDDQPPKKGFPASLLFKIAAGTINQDIFFTHSTFSNHRLELHPEGRLLASVFLTITVHQDPQ